MICKVDGCDRNVFVKAVGLCKRHYDAIWLAKRAEKLKLGSCLWHNCKSPIYKEGKCKKHWIEYGDKKKKEQLLRGIEGIWLKLKRQRFIAELPDLLTILNLHLELRLIKDRQNDFEQMMIDLIAYYKRNNKKWNSLTRV